VWNETEPKPTDKELQEYWYSIEHGYLEQEMRMKRNQLLSESDYKVVSDYPDRDQFLVYRQQLRDLPANWTIDTPFPQPPTQYKRNSFFILGLYIWHCLGNF
jgi:hypothetical protein